MKKTTTLLLAALFGSFAVSAQIVQVPKTTIPMVNKVTAAWCPPCGGAAWTAFDDMIVNMHEEVIFMGTYADQGSSYSNDKLYSQAADDLAGEWGTTAFPSFYFNGEFVDNGWSLSGAETSTADFVANDAPAQVGFFSEMKNPGELTVYTAVEFFEDVDGIYNLAAYILEDKVENPQASITSQTEDTQHHEVLRAEMSDNGGFGTNFLNGAAKAGKRFESEFTFEIPAEWVTENITIAMVIWQQDGGWKYVNGNHIESAAQFEPPVSVEEINETNTLSLYPNPASSNFTIEMENTVAGEYLIEIYNQLGQSVQTVYNGMIGGNLTQRFDLSVDGMANGLYYVKVNNGSESKAMRLNVAH